MVFEGFFMVFVGFLRFFNWALRFPWGFLGFYICFSGLSCFFGVAYQLHPPTVNPNVLDAFILGPNPQSTGKNY